jgi:spermidine/putrescine transport system permease protein
MASRTRLEAPGVTWTMRVLTALAVAFIYIPPLYLLLLSFNAGLLPTVPAPGEMSLKWYVALAGEERMLRGLRQSVLLGLATAVIATLIAVPAALAYLEFRKRRAPWFNFVLFSMFVPGVVQGLSLSVIFRVIGIKPSMLTMVAGHLLWALPFAFIVILINLSAVRRNLMLAAQDLGASRWQTFRDVTFPLIRPGVIGALLFSFLLSFNEFSRAYYLVGAQDTLPIYMFGVMNAGTSPTIYALAGSTLAASFLCIGLALLVARHTTRR